MYSRKQQPHPTSMGAQVSLWPWVLTECGVHVLKHRQGCSHRCAAVVVPTFRSLEHLCMALATNERTGSIGHDVYNQHVFTDPSNMMMNLAW